MIELTVRFKPTLVCHEINIFLPIFEGKVTLPPKCSQPLRYCKNTFCGQEKRWSLMGLNGTKSGFLSDWYAMTFSTFMISKNVSSNKQKSAVPAASGGPYVDKTLLIDKLKTQTASLTFMMEYGVNLTC